MKRYWREPETIHAIANYARLAVGLVIIGVLVYRYLGNAMNTADLLTALGGLVGLDRIIIGGLGALNRNR